MPENFDEIELQHHFDFEDELSIIHNQNVDNNADPIRQILNNMDKILFMNYKTSRDAIYKEQHHLTTETKENESEDTNDYDFYRGKSLRTVASYRSRQLNFIAWARKSIDCNYPEIVTSRRAVLYMTENLERVNSKNSINGPGMYDACTSALSELMEMQREAIGLYPVLADPNEPRLESWPITLRDILVRSYIGTKKRFDTYVKKPLAEMTTDATDPVEYMTSLEKLSKEMLENGRFCMHFVILGCHTLMMKAESMKDMELSNIILGKTEKGDKILYFETFNSIGFSEISASLRHKNPLLCSHLSLALLLFSRFHIRRNRKFEEPIDFSDSKTWHRIKVIRGLTPTSTFSSNRFEVKIRQELTDCGVKYKNLPHYFQDCSARYCLDNSLPTEDVRIFGHWDRNPDLQDPDRIVPLAPMTFLAGFKEGEPYKVIRSELPPPQSVCNKIFPFINPYLEAISNGTLEELIISERKAKDKPNLDNTESTEPDGERKSKKRKSKHYRPSSEDLQKVIDVVSVLDYLRSILVQDIPVIKQHIPTVGNRHMFQWNDFVRFSALQCQHSKYENIPNEFPTSVDSALGGALSSIHLLKRAVNFFSENFPSMEHLESIDFNSCSQSESDSNDANISNEDLETSLSGFQPKECLTIHEVYEDFKRLNMHRDALVKKFGLMKKISQHRAYQRRQNIYRLVGRFLTSGYQLKEALDILEQDFASRHMNINSYCDMNKDEVKKKYHLKT